MKSPPQNPVRVSGTSEPPEIIVLTGRFVPEATSMLNVLFVNPPMPRDMFRPDKPEYAMPEAPMLSPVRVLAVSVPVCGVLLPRSITVMMSLPNP